MKEQVILELIDNAQDNKVISRFQCMALKGFSNESVVRALLKGHEQCMVSVSALVKHGNGTVTRHPVSFWRNVNGEIELA